MSASRHGAYSSPYSRTEGYRPPEGAAQWLRTVALAVVVFFTFFVNNGVLVPDIMESRNLITAREMVESGEYMVPTMNGELRLAKPPLPTWIAAGIESVSPDDVAAQRCAAGVAGVILTVFVYLFALRVMRTDPLWPTLILLTCYNVVLMGRTASWDIWCHAFMTGGIYFLAVALQGNGRQTTAFAWSGVFTGLSIMSKGPVSLYALFLPWLIATLCCRRGSIKGKWGGVALMAVTTLVCGCWWYAYIYVCHTRELHAVAAQESGAWMHRNVRPFWYYHKFYLEAGVWAVLLLTAIVLSVVRRSNSRGAMLPLIWMLASLLLLSALPEKKTRYLLPVLIPASLLMGQLIGRWISDFRSHARTHSADKVLFRINAWLLVAVAAALPVAAWWFCYKEGSMALWALAVLCVICVGAVAALGYSACTLRPAVTVWSVAVLFATAEAVALPSIKPLINNPAMHSIRLTADRPDLRGIPYFANSADELRIELVYAARRDITSVPFTDSALSSLPLPAVVMTRSGAGAELPYRFLQKVDTTYIGRFDDNRRPPESGRYDSKFIYHLTLLKPKRQ